MLFPQHYRHGLRNLPMSVGVGFGSAAIFGATRTVRTTLPYRLLGAMGRGRTPDVSKLSWRAFERQRILPVVIGEEIEEIPERMLSELIVSDLLETGDLGFSDEEKRGVRAVGGLVIWG